MLFIILCGQSVQLLDITVGCTHSYHSTIMVRLISVTWLTTLGGGGGGKMDHGHYELYEAVKSGTRGMLV
jgi:hypothetical protein